MKIHLYFLLALLLTAGVARGQERQLLQDRIALGRSGMEILTRGPVHEAFAGTVTYDAEPGLIVQSTPPQAIEEVAPDQRPEGDDMTWIQGYWAWDDDRNDFLWVSGIWRSLPPDRQWVPGYWRTDGERARWTTGFWADAQAREIEYLPEPPASVEEGPQGEAASADHVWIPGVWLWRDSRYLWRPGFWAQGYPNWDWIPDHYVWSPRGYVFVDGYYDYPVDQRGVLFAPVYFTSRDYARRDFTYSPSVAISTSVLGSHLFLRPSYGHYYFGDYYDSRYAARGMTSWSSYHIGRTGYDPLYARQRWDNRANQAWEQTIRSNYQARLTDASQRPPRTWAEQEARLNQRDGAADLTYRIGEAYDKIARDNLAQDNIAQEKERGRRFRAVELPERQQYIERQQAIQRSRDERQKLEQLEADATTPVPRTTRDFTRSRAPLPASPIMGRPSDQIERGLAPPSRQRGPEPDLKVEPRRRAARVDLDGEPLRGPGRRGNGPGRPEPAGPRQPRPDAAPAGDRPAPDGPAPGVPAPTSPAPMKAEGDGGEKPQAGPGAEPAAQPPGKPMANKPQSGPPAKSKDKPKDNPGKGPKK